MLAKEAKGNIKHKLNGNEKLLDKDELVKTVEELVMQELKSEGKEIIIKKSRLFENEFNIYVDNIENGGIHKQNQCWEIIKSILGKIDKNKTYILNNNEVTGDSLGKSVNEELERLIKKQETPTKISDEKETMQEEQVSRKGIGKKLKDLFKKGKNNKDSETPQTGNGSRKKGVAHLRFVSSNNILLNSVQVDKRKERDFENGNIDEDEQSQD